MTTQAPGTIAHCEGCPYRAVGPAIGSRGDPGSRLVLVGEAPGKREIEERRPFCGRAGRILQAALREARIDEATVFITNAVACRPVPVHPRRLAIAACRGRLQTELESAQRSAIVALGATALASLTGRYDLKITLVRGAAFDSRWGPTVATLHPARLLRRPGDRRLLVADLMFGARLASGSGT